MNLAITMPGEAPVTTREKLNEMIDRGFRFTGQLATSGDPVRVLAVADHVGAGFVRIVTSPPGAPHLCCFADISPESIRYAPRQDRTAPFPTMVP